MAHAMTAVAGSPMAVDALVILSAPESAAMSPLPIAHAGHWFEGALYLAPVIILALVLLWQGRGAEGDAAADPAGGESDGHA
jgi:hypothetical protein